MGKGRKKSVVCEQAGVGYRKVRVFSRHVEIVF